MLEDEYVSVLFVQALPDLTKTAYQLIGELTRHGAVNTASIIERALVAVYDELEAISVAYAKVGRDMVVQEEESSRVRPDTELAPDQRMEHYFECDPIPNFPGAVGFINKEVIDNSPADWWWTNEIGFSGHVGREVHGFFFKAGFVNPSWPATAQSREHPLFRPSGQGAPIMTILEPIPERRFARAALDRLEGEWLTAVNGALNRYQITVTMAMEGAMQIVYAPIP